MEQNDKTQRANKASRVNAPNRISSPDQLTDYLRVTNPGVWVLLASVVLLLAGLFAWSSIGTLETVIDVKVNVADNRAVVIPEGMDALAAGMPLKVSSGEYIIGSTETDMFGRIFGIAEVFLPDGLYDGTVVTERTHPISFLLESR